MYLVRSKRSEKITKKTLAKIAFILLIVSIALSLTCRQFRDKASPHPEELKKGKIILTIEEKEYSEEDFYRYVERQVGRKAEDLSPAALSRLLDQFIEEKLWLEAARQAGINVSSEDKEAYKRSKLMANLDLSPSENDEAFIIERLMIEKYIQMLAADIDISEEEIKNYYEQNKREFLLPERVKVSQILVNSEAEAVRLQNQLKAGGEALFRQLARENSLGPESSRGGEMGIFKLNELPEEIEKVIFSLKEGEISSVVESPYGFHIFRLDSRLEPRLLSLEEASDKIRAKLLQEKVEALMKHHLEEIKARIRWEFLPERLSFSYKKENP